MGLKYIAFYFSHDEYIIYHYQKTSIYDWEMPKQDWKKCMIFLKSRVNGSHVCFKESENTNSTAQSYCSPLPCFNVIFNQKPCIVFHIKLVLPQYSLCILESRLINVANMRRVDKGLPNFPSFKTSGSVWRHPRSYAVSYVARYANVSKTPLPSLASWKVINFLYLGQFSIYSDV